MANKVTKMNYEAERAMNQKRLRMEGEPGHGVVQGNGLPLNYMDNGHQIPYQPYAGAYNPHYPPPDAFASYGPPPPGGYAPQNLSYAPPAHQNYPHHQSFPPQQPTQTQLHMQSHMVQGYGDVGVHKAAWPPQSHLLSTLDTQKPLDVKQLKPEIKVEPMDAQKRSHPNENDIMNEMDQPKIKIKTDIFKPDELGHRPDTDKPLDGPKPLEVVQQAADSQVKDDVPGEAEKKPLESIDKEKVTSCQADTSTPLTPRPETTTPGLDKPIVNNERKIDSVFGTPKMNTTPIKMEPKKRGRPKGSTNKPKPPGSMPNKVLTPNTPNSMTQIRGGSSTPRPHLVGRPRGTSFQYAIRPFRKDFSGIQFRRRWSDDCLDSSHIPNEVYFGDVPVSTEVLYNYYDANAERERLAAQAAHIAAQKAAAAKLAAAKLQARGLIGNEPVTTVDSSSDDDSSGSSGSDTSDSDDDQPLKRGRGRPVGSKNSGTPRPKSGHTPGRRGRPPVPPELREPGIMEMKKFCKAAGIRFDYKKLVAGCTKNKERVQKMLDLLIGAGLEGKPTLEKCAALKQAKLAKKEKDKQAKESNISQEGEDDSSDMSVSRRMTRGQTGVKPRQKIVISSDEEDDTPDARRALSKLRSLVKDESDSN